MSSGEQHLRSREVSALLAALDRLYAPVGRAEFPGHLFGVLAELLPDTLTTLDFLDLSTGKVETHVAPILAETVSVPEMEAVIRQYLWQNPVVDHLIGKNAAVVMQPTDVISQRQFRRTDLYALGFPPAGLDSQGVAGLSWPGRIGGFAVNRPGPRNFTASEVTLVGHLRPHVERAFMAAWRTGVRRAAAPAAALTQREEEVLHWLGAGKRNAEIALILGISPRTVHKHVEHVLAKLGVETRTAAVATLAQGSASHANF